MGRGFALFEVGPPGTHVVDARRAYLMQPAQDLRSFFLRASAEGRERALIRRNGSPRIPVGQRYATDHLGGRRIDEVHHLAAAGSNVGSIDVVRRDRLIRVGLHDCFHRVFSLCENFGQNEVTTRVNELYGHQCKRSSRAISGHCAKSLDSWHLLRESLFVRDVESSLSIR
jgi:hypothetical protein